VGPKHFALLLSLEGDQESNLRPVKASEILQARGVTREEWRQAAIREIEGLQSKGVYRIPTKDEIARAQRQNSILPMKVVAGEKPTDVSSGVDSRKKQVRLVACGNFDKREQVTTLGTTQVDPDTMRVILKLAARKQWAIATADVRQAFLEADLELIENADNSQIVVATPKFLADLGVLEQQYWLLAKALYGLRESPIAWQITRDKELSKMRFRLTGKTFELQRSGADPSVWFVVDIAKKSEEPLAVILTYVDDFLMTGPPEVLQGVLTEIQKVWTLGAQKVVKSKSGEQIVFLGRDPDVDLRRGGSHPDQVCEGPVRQVANGYCNSGTDTSRCG
jgi:hypothetical protein